VAQQGSTTRLGAHSSSRTRLPALYRWLSLSKPPAIDSDASTGSARAAAFDDRLPALYRWLSLSKPHEIDSDASTGSARVAAFDDRLPVL
jgi:hypothetical protein